MSKKILETVPIPAMLAGIGLRSPHLSHIIKNTAKIKKTVGWFEVHSENYYTKNNPAINSLIEVRKNFPISLHSVGNSLGSASGLDLKHLKKLKELIKIIDPFLVSDHISWGKIDEMHLNDLLPLPYTKAALKVIKNNVNQMQDFLGREILVENPSTYLSFKSCEMSEYEFINDLCNSTGCKLLLDVNNIFVSGFNNPTSLSHNFSAAQKNASTFSINSEENILKICTEYVTKIDKKIVAEIHLAGHSENKIFDGKKHKTVLIDTHDNLVRSEVWELYQIAIKRFGKIPTLIEWDQDIPKLEVLLGEAKRAGNILKN